MKVERDAVLQSLFMYKCFGTTTELMVQDASAFAEEGEQLSFWQIQVCFNPIEDARLVSQLSGNVEKHLRSSCYGLLSWTHWQRNGFLTRDGPLLQARALAVRQTLMGYYDIPTTVDSPLNLVVNPEGNEERCRRVVWNNGDSRCGQSYLKQA